MKKISLYLLMILATGMLTSCGDDEPEITRVQDGNGKVFLETGTLIVFDDESTAKYTVLDKHILITNEVQVGVNNYSYYDKLDVVSLDLTKGAGRMIIDRIVPNGYGKSDYVNTTYTRMVWRAVIQ